MHAAACGRGNRADIAYISKKKTKKMSTCGTDSGVNITPDNMQGNYLSTVQGDNLSELKQFRHGILLKLSFFFSKTFIMMLSIPYLLLQYAP